ncbi:MAG: 50S ribosomal protein L18 [Tepidiforma sp.]|jgi:large subunit ribosomal protein L18|uniref:Large ribosomal subunit protein uL18 n=1 Tax=Tepidiforma bonchosmolovskayae TaxID=2601677 RepID=A0ABX6C2S1_9CHLR|nr:MULTISPECIES: 50S ribosomal protein L18 [Tepidiforma]QFG03517.1 50S ribosomal protein L18 [Tepidiforma bonchosmolovskayae]GIW16415.1 MAG: 50S ribosomal protein L18 [Tepidiforma sp.]
MSTTTSVLARKRRHLRVRKKVSGTPQRPRLNVFRSAQHIYAQVIDDTVGRTLVAASDVEPAIAEQAKGKTKTERAALVGTIIAERARAKGIETVVFDRGGFLYHGRVRALAEAAREAGLGF